MAELTAKQPEKDQDRYYAWLLWMADKMREPEELVFAEGAAGLATSQTWI